MTWKEEVADKAWLASLCKKAGSWQLVKEVKARSIIEMNRSSKAAEVSTQLSMKVKKK